MKISAQLTVESDGKKITRILTREQSVGFRREEELNQAMAEMLALIDPRPHIDESAIDKAIEGKFTTLP